MDLNCLLKRNAGVQYSIGLSQPHNLTKWGKPGAGKVAWSGLVLQSAASVTLHICVPAPRHTHTSIDQSHHSNPPPPVSVFFHAIYNGVICFVVLDAEV